MPLLELVPNISEGRSIEVVSAVKQAFLRAGVQLLDADGNHGANRTVLTLVGEADALVEAAVAGAEAAAERIDLRRHRGVHVRMGALDVCPFVPLAGLVPGGGDLRAAVVAARETAERIGRVGIPVYIYGEAALSPRRQLLHEVRREGFESLAVRMAHDPPDFGPLAPHPSAGATAVGARFFLVAFNVNLTTADVAIAQTIARRIREIASVKRDESGAVVVATAGRLRGVRARGWFVEDFGCAQVTTNVTDYRLTPLHLVLEAVREEAKTLGVSVRGSELIGCVPLEPMRMAGWAAGAPRGASDAELVSRAAESLGLGAVKPFDPARKVLEWAIEARETT